MIRALVAALLVAAPLRGAPTPEAVVHAVLFYSPTCPHCHTVITQVLPPLQEKYGAALRVAGVDVTTPHGQSLYQAVVKHYGLSADRQGVPALVVGSQVLVGDVEIPARFPTLIEEGLAAGGIDWPPVTEVRQALTAQGMLEEHPAQEEAAPATLPPSTGTGIAGLPQEIPSAGVWARFGMDPLANTIAVLILLGMLVSLAATLRSVAGGAPPPLTLSSWAIPLLAAVGMGVASYLTLVEMTGAVAVCGPIGDCNTVQHSSYAVLFGMPVGALGQAGYLAMFLSWALAALGPRRWRDAAWLALWALALGGVAFSAYLTFLEPFIIGATCIWCLTSAVVMTLILMAATPPVAAQRKATLP